jgi:hypothetical protein
VQRQRQQRTHSQCQDHYMRLGKQEVPLFRVQPNLMK